MSRGIPSIIGFLLLALAAVIIALAITSPARAIDGCEPEPASEWAPAGWICQPQFGEGTASTWGGPGVARNDCVFPWDDCTPIRITSLEPDSYGNWIEVRPTMWCHCYVNAPGPNGETARLVDLPPDVVASLGLPGEGLWKVRVEPAGGVVMVDPGVREDASSNTLLPNTAMAAP